MRPRTSAWLVVALHEYVTNVRRKEFILITLGLPVMILFFGGLSLLGTTVATGAFRARSTQTVGIVDRSQALDLTGGSEGMPPSVVLVAYQDIAAGQADVRAGKIGALVILDRDYLATGRVAVYRQGGSLFDQSERIPLGTILTRGLLARTGADPTIIHRAVDPTQGGTQVYVLDKSRQFVPRSIGREAARLIVPYAFTVLLSASIFISASYLLRGIADEKENRVIEVILSTVSAEDLLRGKLLGLAGVGLTQVGVWIGVAALPILLRFSEFVQISASMLAQVLLFFVLGFGLYAALMAGLGALGTSYRESQQIAGMVSFGAIFPYLLIPALLESPNGLLARILSGIPFTAPTTMVLRVSATDVPLLDVALSAGLILLATWLVMKLSAKLFRFGLLIYGKRPSFRETLRWLRQS